VVREPSALRLTVPRTVSSSGFSTTWSTMIAAKKKAAEKVVLDLRGGKPSKREVYGLGKR